LGDYLLAVYSRTFLEYFEQKSLKFSSHYYVMVYIKNLSKNVIVKKIQIHLQMLLLFKNIGYNDFKMFLGIFHSLNWFQTFKVYIPIH